MSAPGSAGFQPALEPKSMSSREGKSGQEVRAPGYRYDF